MKSRSLSFVMLAAVLVLTMVFACGRRVDDSGDQTGTAEVASLLSQ